MKKVSAWLVPISLVLIALTIAACAPAATPAPAPSPAPTPSTTPAPSPTPSPAPAPSSDKPRYGGVIQEHDAGTFMSNWNVFGATSAAIGPVYEGLLYGDWYAPESVFPSYQVDPPQKGVAGWLAESWEMTDPQTFVFHLRKGVRFYNKPPVNGRELTAQDVKWSFDTCLSSPLSQKGILPIIDKTTVIDKYTVSFHTSQPRTTDFLYEAFQGSTANGGLIVPHEVMDTYGKDAFNNWTNAIGTGPFIPKDYIAGSSATYVRNPDYWEFDKNYPENKLPYVDKINVIIITDASTALSALRTGKIDRHMAVKFDQVDTLLKTSPWLKSRRVPATGASKIAINMKNKPFTDVRVRQALSMAVNHEAFIKDIYGGFAQLGIDTHPYLPWWKDYYMPLKDYPQIVQDQFHYNPAKAKQLLTDAGYPNGFKTEMLAQQTDADNAALVKAYLNDVGVDAQIKLVEPSVKSGTMYNKQFPGLAIHSTTGGSTSSSAAQSLVKGYAPGIFNFSNYDDPAWEAMLDKAQQTQDNAARYKMYKELAVKMLTDAPNILLPTPDKFYFWAPWIKGGYWGQGGMTWSDKNMDKHFWIDTELKTSVTGGE